MLLVNTYAACPSLSNESMQEAVPKWIQELKN